MGAFGLVPCRAHTSTLGVHSCVKRTGERAVPPGVGARSSVHTFRLGVSILSAGPATGQWSTLRVAGAQRRENSITCSSLREENFYLGQVLARSRILEPW